ncbi:hemolysin III family protein [bacterium]|nr:hemolysin III family protein [bacterium]
MSDHHYSKGEEIANSLTHGLGVLLSIAGLIVLVIYATINGTAIHVVSASIFGSTLILLYTASTLYHSFQSPRAKRVMRILDHSGIYLLIAGTYTPFTLISLNGAWGWSLFGVVWGLALAGVIFKIFFTGRFSAVSTIIYLGMGWIAIVAIKPMLELIPTGGLLWILAGGLAYSFGVIFYAWKKLPYAHAVWHMFVLGGSVCHFFAVLLYVIP